MKFLKIISLLFVIATLASCATIFNKKEKKIIVSSNILNAKLKYNDSLYSLPSKIYAKRKNEDLKLEIVSDSLNKVFTIPYKHDTKFILGNLAFLYFAPVGYGVDLTNKKRFSYPSEVHLNALTDSIYIDYYKTNYVDLDKIEEGRERKTKKLKRMQRKKGDYFYNIIAPSFHGYNLVGHNSERYKNSGFVGLGIGLDYYYKDHKFFNTEVSFKSNYYDLVISPYTIDDEVMLFNFSVTDNLRLKRFELGYGLKLTFNHLKYKTYQLSDQQYIGNNNIPSSFYNRVKFNENSFQLGLSTRASYQLSGFLHVGLFFRPTFVRLNKSNIESTYESLYGLDLRFKF